MKKLFGGVRISVSLVVLLGSFAGILFAPHHAGAAGETISGGTAVVGAPSTQIPISDLQIVTTGNPTLPVKLRVTSGTLSMTTTTGLTFNGGSTGSTIYFSGTLTNLNAALATLRYTRSGTGTDTLEMSLVDAGEVFFPDNGHLYEYVSTTLDWNGAKTAAESRSKYGASGYLATITSSAENSFVAARLSNQGWMGASDVASEGSWRWVTGPEAGTLFWTGTSSGSVASGQYASWNGGEPNDSSSNEDCGQYLIGGGLWNDLPCSGTTLPGYVVEYGAPGNLPSVASKNVGVTVTNTSISGTVYTDSGVTNIGAGTDVTLLVNGTSIGTVTTNASGQYSKVGVALNNDDIITAFIDNETQKGVTVQRNNGASATLDIWQNTLTARSAGASALTASQLATANNSDSDILIIYADDSSTLALASSINLYIPTGSSVTVPDGGVPGTVRIDGTLTVSSGNLYVYDNVSISGTITGAGTLFFYGSGTQTLTQTGTISLSVVNWKGSGILRFMSNITVSGSNWFTIYDNTGSTDCNNYALSVAYFDINEAGTYSCASGNVTASSTMFVRTAGAVFNTGSGTLDINELIVSGGTFNASSGNTYISGSLTVSPGASFVTPNGGTLTFDGGDQYIEGDLSLYNLTVADPTNNSTDFPIIFNSDSTFTIRGALTLNGYDSNDRVSITSSGSNSVFNLTGASSSFTGDYVYVKNSTAVTSSGSTVSLPLSPVTSYNGGNNSGWFGVSISGTTNGSEPSTAAVFTITATGQNASGSNLNVVVSYSGSATAGTDYNDSTVTVAIPSGSSSATLSVPVIDDSIVEESETVTVTLTSASSYTVISPSNASRTISSNDLASIVVSPTSDSISEGSTKTIGVSLGIAPSSDVIIDLASNNASEISIDKTSLTFTPANWSTTQNVTASAVRDYKVITDRSATITASPNGGSTASWLSATPASSALSIANTDAAGVTISPVGVSIAEGSSSSATITLDTIPGSSVVITATPQNGIDLGSGNGNPKSFTFAAGSRTPNEAFTVTAVDNKVVDKNRLAEITFAVTSTADSGYTGLAIGQKLAVTIIDDDKYVAPVVTEEPTTTPATTEPTGEKIILNNFTEYTEQGKPAELTPGQVVYFTVTKEAANQPTAYHEEHSVTINAVADTYVDVTIASTPQYARLFVGETKQFDVDKDGKNDIEISLRGIRSGKADLTFKQLGSAVTATAAKTAKSWHWLPWAIAITTTFVMFSLYKKRYSNQKEG